MPRRGLCSIQAWGLLALAVIVAVLSFVDFASFSNGVVKVCPTAATCSEAIPESSTACSARACVCALWTLYLLC